MQNVLLAVADYQAEEHRLELKFREQKLRGLGLVKSSLDIRSASA